MSWPDHTIWWHVYALGFCGAPIRDPDASAASRLRRLIGWLDYIADLGANGLLLGPLFASETHGYDSVDQFSIDPRLGDEDDFDELVAACRARDIRVVLDGVFSHVGRSHPLLVRALHGEADGDDAALFDIDWHSPGGPAPRVFEGHTGLARLDHTAARAEDYVVDVMTHWLDRGIDGWRLDAAYSIDPSFWARVLPRVRASHGDAWIFGEVIHGDYDSFVATSGVDTVTQYELWKAIWSSLADRNLFELDWALTRHNRFLEHFTPHTFVGNHDVTRISSLVGNDGAVIATAILMTVGGIPAIYSGDEQGFTGTKEERLGGDDAVRPAFPDRPDQLDPSGRPVHDAHRQLIALRRREPWLTTATTEEVDLENTRYTYRTTARDGSKSLTVSIDVTGAPTVAIRNTLGEIVWRQSP